MIFALIFILLLIIFSIYAFRQLDFQSDYCLEDGECETGRVIIVDDKEITINKQTCISYSWDWHEKSKTCKIPMKKFKVKEIIYE